MNLIQTEFTVNPTPEYLLLLLLFNLTAWWQFKVIA